MSELPHNGAVARRLMMVLNRFPKASETFIMAKLVGLTDRGWDVHVACNSSDESDWEFFPHVRDREDLRRRVYVSRSIDWLTRSIEPDVVHFEFGNLAAARIREIAHLPARRVVSFRGPDISFLGLDRPAYYEDVWELADAVHVLGEDLWERARQRGCPPDKLRRLIPPALAPEVLEHRPRQHQDVVGTPDRPFRLISVGRLHWMKGHEYALHAVRMLLDAGVHVDYRIFGGFDYREADHHVRFAIRDLGLDSNVELMGARPRSEVIQHMLASDLFLHAAVSEGFCNAVLEAQALGLPVVSTDADGLGENLIDGKTGYVVPRRHPHRLAERVHELAARPEERMRLGAAGRLRAEREFTLERQMARFVDLYEDVLALPADGAAELTGQDQVEQPAAAELAGTTPAKEGQTGHRASPPAAPRRASWFSSLWRRGNGSGGGHNGGAHEKRPKSPRARDAGSGKPLVSIVINNYNYADYLSEAISSAFDQTYGSTEVVVVDDGSEDHSREIIKEHSSEVVPVLKDNGGQGSAFNAGFEVCSGDVVLFLDADDLLLPSAAEACAEVFSAGDISKVHWSLWEIDSSGERTDMLRPEALLPRGDLRPQLTSLGPRSYTSSPTSGNAWSRRALERILPMPTAPYVICADAYLLALAPLFGPVERILSPQSLWRRHGENKFNSAQVSLEQRLKEEVWRFEEICAALERALRQEGVPADASLWKRRNNSFRRMERVLLGISEIANHVPPNGTYILVDDGDWSTGNWSGSEVLSGRTMLPFFSEVIDGAPPVSDRAVVREFERLRGSGATHAFFAWPGTWWLEHYPNLKKHLAGSATQVVRRGQLVGFDLRQS